MQAMVDAGGAPVDWRGRDGRYGMVQKRNGLRAELSARLPSLHVIRRYPTQDPTTVCDGLPECRSWEPASMAIAVGLELPDLQGERPDSGEERG